MPAVRLSTNRRRRSSLAISYTAVKPGIYGINQRPVTFAPNVTPVSYVEPEAGSSSSSPEPSAAFESLFPPSEAPAKPPTRRRIPPGKRPSKGYIPRPPNAFMLFRADFVKQKHVPGSIETNHGSLSKIIGNCWRALPLEEKRVWEVKAKHAKAEHKVQYPEYRFKPVHNKNKDKKKDKPVTTLDDERRCEEVAQLLLEGKKGDELAAAVRHLDQRRHETPPVPAPVYHHRRSSSVPLPNDYYPHNFGYPLSMTPNIALPSLPFFSQQQSLSRAQSPVSSISRQHQQRLMLGQRRASSVDPNLMVRSWDIAPFNSPRELQRDHSPLPEADTSLFDPAFLDGFSSSFSSNSSTSSFPPSEFTGGAPQRGRAPAFSISDLLPTLPRLTGDGTVSPHDLYPPTQSQPSTAYSGSPPPLESSAVPVHAPQPQAPFGEMWNEFAGVGEMGTFPMHQEQEGYQHHQSEVQHTSQQHGQEGFDLGLGLGFAQQQPVMQEQDGFCSAQYGMDNLFGAPQVYGFHEYA
ncbi:hypothetical protein BD779DRAFT_1542919 [Infundibulicybe gibba]|nr:hypothetical protein BD779DRAFT_1542919 [Infundibulicybe gibba]